MTCLEAHYKRIPTIVSSTAVGLRAQVLDGVTGILTTNPRDPQDVASSIRYALTHREVRSSIAFNGQACAVKNGLIFSQIDKWLSLLLEGLHSKINHSS